MNHLECPRVDAVLEVLLALVVATVDTEIVSPVMPENGVDNAVRDFVVGQVLDSVEDTLAAVVVVVDDGDFLDVVVLILFDGEVVRIVAPTQEPLFASVRSEESLERP